MPLFSIITPAYNAEQYIRDCVASVKAQNLDDWEMVVVDDGSTDGTARLVAVLAASDSRVRLLSKINGGVSSARNAGLDAARGRYVVFLDSDDEMPTGTLAAYAGAIEQQAPDVVQGVASRVDAQGRKLSSIFVTPRMASCDTAREAVDALALPDKAPLLHYIWNKAYRRELLERACVRFDESVSLGEDFIFNCAIIAQAGPIAFVNADVCRYIQRDAESLTRRFRPDELIRRRKMEAAFRGLLEVFGQWEAKRPFYEQSTGLIALESAKSVALPGCALTGAQKRVFVQSFQSSEYRAHVAAYVSSAACTKSSRLLGCAFLSGSPGAFVAACTLASKLKGFK